MNGRLRGCFALPCPKRAGPGSARLWGFCPGTRSAALSLPIQATEAVAGRDIASSARIERPKPTIPTSSPSAATQAPETVAAADGLPCRQIERSDPQPDRQHRPRQPRRPSGRRRGRHCFTVGMEVKTNPHPWAAVPINPGVQGGRQMGTASGVGKPKVKSQPVPVASLSPAILTSEASAAWDSSGSRHASEGQNSARRGRRHHPRAFKNVVPLSSFTPRLGAQFMAGFLFGASL